MLSTHSQLAASEQRLLDEAEEFATDMSLANLTSDAMHVLTRDHGIDFATAVLYFLCNRSDRSEHGLPSSKPLAKLPSQALQIAIVPGAFYVEHPHTGADGRRLRAAAMAAGVDCHTIPVESVGLLETNARTIIDWLLEHATRPTALVTFCKGGADLKAALRHPQAEQAFYNVRSWYSVCGILGGSPMVDWVYQRQATLFAARLLFLLRRRNFQFFSQLRSGPDGALGQSIDCPGHVQLFHVVGFPLTSHLSNSRSRKWHHRLSRFGPSDGATLLLDVCQQPGRVLPVWGVDHYAADRVDWTALVQEIVSRTTSTADELDSSSVSPPGRLTASTL